MRYVVRTNGRKVHMQDEAGQPTYCGQTSAKGRSPFHETPATCRADIHGRVRLLPQFHRIKDICDKCIIERSNRENQAALEQVEWVQQSPTRWTATSEYGTYTLEWTGAAFLLTFPQTRLEAHLKAAPATEEHRDMAAASAAVLDLD